MPSLSRKSYSKKKSALSRKKSSVKHRHASQTKRKSAVVKKSRSNVAKAITANFWCMGCKAFSKSPIDRYDKGKNGSMFAKGRCSRCDGKVSVIVKADDVKR